MCINIRSIDISLQHKPEVFDAFWLWGEGAWRVACGGGDRKWVAVPGARSDEYALGDCDCECEVSELR